MANRTVTNNPGNRGSQPTQGSTERDTRTTPDTTEGNPTPVGNPLGNRPADVTDRGKAPAPSRDDDR